MSSPSPAQYSNNSDSAHLHMETLQLNLTWCELVQQLSRCGFHKMEEVSLPRLHMGSQSVARLSNKCDSAHLHMEMPQLNLSWCEVAQQLWRCRFHKVQEASLAVVTQSAAHLSNKCNSAHIHMEMLQLNLSWNESL